MIIFSYNIIFGDIEPTLHCNPVEPETKPVGSHPDRSGISVATHRGRRPRTRRKHPVMAIDAPDVRQPPPAQGASVAGDAAGAAARTLAPARHAALEARRDHPGGVSPVDAWRLVSAQQAVLVDVRTVEEQKYVGHVPG